jgi:hypothetical protein
MEPALQDLIARLDQLSDGFACDLSQECDGLERAMSEIGMTPW